MTRRASRQTPPILPGATLGILGGGQLGRMMAMAARTLGYHIHVLDPDASCAARFVVDRCITASFEDARAADILGAACDVVTLEIEKVSLASMHAAERHAPMRPGPHVLGIIQDRVAQKQWLARRKFPVGPFAVARGPKQLAAAVRKMKSACYVKAARGGYDGRGQAFLAAPDMAEAAWDDLGGHPCVVEKALAIEAEVSVLVARRPGGEMAVYPPSLNHHDNRILEYCVIPAPISRPLAKQAAEIAREIAEAMDVVGLLVVELFVVEGRKLLVNELAPRPHNTFHGTEVACLTSQFEQAVRAVCDLPLGATECIRPVAIHNLLGDLWVSPPEPGKRRPRSSAGGPAFERALALPGVRVHLYGKREARAGRKMGHLSAVGKTPEEAVALVRKARRALE